MTEFLNHYSGWLTLITFILAFPMGVGINLVTPKVQSWLALRSKKGGANRIHLLQTRIKEIETLLSTPTLAITKFVNLSFKGLAGLIFLVLIFIALTGFSESISYFSRPESIFSTYLNKPIHISLTFLIVNILVILILTVPLVALLSAPVFQLQELTYRIENFDKWKQGTLREISELKRESRSKK